MILVPIKVVVAGCKSPAKLDLDSFIQEHQLSDILLKLLGKEREKEVRREYYSRVVKKAAKKWLQEGNQMFLDNDLTVELKVDNDEHFKKLLQRVETRCLAVQKKKLELEAKLKALDAQMGDILAEEHPTTITPAATTTATDWELADFEDFVVGPPLLPTDVGDVWEEEQQSIVLPALPPARMKHTFTEEPAAPAPIKKKLKIQLSAEVVRLATRPKTPPKTIQANSPPTSPTTTKKEESVLQFAKPLGQLQESLKVWYSVQVGTVVKVIVSPFCGGCLSKLSSENSLLISFYSLRIINVIWEKCLIFIVHDIQRFFPTQWKLSWTSTQHCQRSIFSGLRLKMVKLFLATTVSLQSWRRKGKLGENKQ